VKRHSVLPVAAVTAAALLAAGVLASCGSSGTPAADAGSKTVRVTLANHVWTDTIKSKLPEFEKATGLKVELSQFGEDQLSDQYKVKLDAGSKEIDVMMYRPLQEGKLFAKNGYLANLTDDVKADKAFEIGGQFDPVWVTGTMKTETAFTGLADAGYTLDAENVEHRPE